MLHASNPHPQVGHGDWAARYITRLLFKLTPQDVVFAFLSFLGQGVWSDSFLSFLGQGVWSDRVGRCMLTRDEPLVPGSIKKAPRREEAEHPMRNGLACCQHGIPQCIQVSCIARPSDVNNSNQALSVSVTPVRPNILHSRSAVNHSESSIVCVSVQPTNQHMLLLAAGNFLKHGYFEKKTTGYLCGICIGHYKTDRKIYNEMIS